MHIFVRNNSSSWGKQKWRGANISGSAEDGPGDSIIMREGGLIC